MKRLLLAAVLFFVVFQCFAATLPLGPGSVFPIGASAQKTPIFTPSCAQSTSFLNRTSGFTVQQKYNYDTLICSLVTSGTFAKLDALYVLAAPNQAASLLNLVSTSYSLTVSGTMTFGANAGWMGDAATGYLATGFIPSSAGGHYAIGNFSQGVGISDPRQTYQGWAAIGSSTTDFSDFDAVFPICTSGGCGGGSNGNYFDTLGVHAISTTPTTANGQWVESLSGGTLTGYFNGTSIATVGATQTEIPNGQIVIGALNEPGVPQVAFFSGDTFAYAFFGSGLNTTDITALNSLLAPFPTFTGGVPAANWGFSNNLFAYNFSTQGISGIDVNSTFNSGYSWYPANWFGASFFFGGTAPPNAWTFSGGVVTESLGARMSTRGPKDAAFTGTISGTNLTVSSVLYGPLLTGQVLGGSSALSANTTITGQSSGTAGGVGVYALSSSATISSGTNLVANSSVGTPTIAPGGYYEIVANWNPANDTGSNGWPSFWLQDITGLQAQNLNTGYGAAAHFAEFDVVEGISGVRGQDMNGIDWTTTNGGGFGTDNSVHELFPAITNPAATHYYGMLWVPSTQNAGTGLIQFYVDRIHVAGEDITYTSSAGASPACAPSNTIGCLFISESGQFVLLVDAGGAGNGTSPYPINLTSVNVWH